MKTKNILLLTLALLSHIFLMGFNDYDLDCETDFYITECIGPAFEDSEGQLFSKVTATIKNNYPNGGNPTSWPSFRELFPAGSTAYIQWEVDGGTFYSTASADGMPAEVVGTTGYSPIFWPGNLANLPFPGEEQIGNYNETSQEITIEAWIKWDSDVKPEYKMVEGEDEEELKNARMVKAKLKYKGDKYSFSITPSKSKLAIIQIIANLIGKIKVSFAEEGTLCEDLGVFTPTPSSIVELTSSDLSCYSKELTAEIKPTNDFCQPVTTKYVWEQKTGSGPYQVIDETTPSTNAASISLVVSDLSPGLSYTFRLTPVIMYTYEPYPGPQSDETISIEGNSKSLFIPAMFPFGDNFTATILGNNMVSPSSFNIYTLDTNQPVKNIEWTVTPSNQAIVTDIINGESIGVFFLSAGHFNICVEGTTVCDDEYFSHCLSVDVDPRHDDGGGFDGGMFMNAPDEDMTKRSSYESLKQLSQNPKYIAQMALATQHDRAEFKVFPTLLSGGQNLNVKVPMSKEVTQIDLIDLSGIPQTSMEIYGEQSVRLSTLDLPAGVYILRARTGEWMASTKVVIK